MRTQPAICRQARHVDVMSQYSALESLLASQIYFIKAPVPVREYRFAAEHVGLGDGLRRRLLEHGLKDWRFDFAWPDRMFAVEVEGISPKGGRHQTVGGFRQDIEKYHAALAMGWVVYRTTSTLIKSGATISLIEKRLQIDKKG